MSSEVERMKRKKPKREAFEYFTPTYEPFWAVFHWADNAFRALPFMTVKYNYRVIAAQSAGFRSPAPKQTTPRAPD